MIISSFVVWVIVTAAVSMAAAKVVVTVVFKVMVWDTPVISVVLEVLAVDV